MQVSEPRKWQSSLGLNVETITLTYDPPWSGMLDGKLIEGCYKVEIDAMESPDNCGSIWFFYGEHLYGEHLDTGYLFIDGDICIGDEFQL